MTDFNKSDLTSDGADDMGRRPAVSIIMPSYNSERFIGAAIESVLAQDFGNFEILVIDDASMDASPKIAEEYARNDRRVRCLTNQRTKGVSGARNTGLDEARGEWISFLDSDDLLTENCLSARMEFVSRNSDCQILTTDYSYIDEAGNIAIERRLDHIGLLDQALKSAVPFDGGFRLERPIQFFFDHNVLIWTGAGMFHSSVIEQAGRFDEIMTHSEDTKYWYQMALHNKVCFLEFASAHYRQHATSTTRDTEKRLKGAEMLYRALSADPEFYAYRMQASKRLAMALNDSSWHFREYRNFRLAARSAVQAILTMPGYRKAWRNLIASILRVG